MIGTSAPNYLFISFAIIGLRAIAPVAIFYCLTLPYHSLRLPSPLHWYFILEASFYFLVYLPLKYASQAPAEHPPLQTREERRALYAKCHRAMPDPEAYMRKWFKDAPMTEIKRDNVKDFFRWGFLNTNVVDADHDEELEEYAQGLEKSLGYPLEPGRGTAEPLLLTLDPVNMLHRPLLWYGIVSACDIFTHIWLSREGFHFYKSQLDWQHSAIPARPQNLITHRQSPSETLSYWYRPHLHSEKRPVVFVHGIGIGLLTYTEFLSQINRLTGTNADVGIIAIEILPISFRITHAALPKEEMCREIEKILAKHGFDTFVLVSHSYGSVISTHMLKDAQLAPKISSVVLVDPVSLLLHQPDVAYNFTHRKPTTANEHQLHYFASTDMCVSHTLARSFFWSDNILWKEDIASRRISVFLAGRDIIVNTKEVARYLSSRPRERATSDSGTGGPIKKDGEKRHRRRSDRSHDYDWIDGEGVWESQDGNVKVFWNKELDHAQVFDSKKRLRVLAGEVLEHCKTSKWAR